MSKKKFRQNKIQKPVSVNQSAFLVDDQVKKSEHRPKFTFTNIIMLFSLPLIWGIAFMFISISVEVLPPLWIVLSRLVIGSIVLMVYIYSRGRKLPKIFPKPDPIWFFGLLVGFFGIFFPFFLLSSAQLTLDSSLTAIYMSVMPLFTILFAHFFANEYLTIRKIFALIIGFIGVLILFGPTAIKQLHSADFLAHFLALFAAISYASAAIIMSRAPKQSSPSVFATCCLICATLISIIASITKGIPDFSSVNLKIIFSLLFLGIFSTAIGTIFYIRVIQNLGPSIVAMTNYLTPIVAILSGILFLNEKLSLYLYIAFVTILAAVYISRSSPKRK